MKIISYNINGIRAAIRKGFLDWLKKENPDVICLQEIKAYESQFNTNDFEKLGYHCFWHSAKKKGYSGVAILSKIKPDNVIWGCGEELFDSEGRILQAEFNNISILSCYFPSGSSGEIRQNFKIQFLNYFFDFVKNKNLGGNILISGDFNICHQVIDIHNPIANKNTSGFLTEEREWLSQFLSLGFIDTFRKKNPHPHHYSWWSYRARARENNKGWRIDYNMLSENLEKKIKSADILTNVYHSDHCPILLELE
jgi:exodeoxyribonuclease-3